MAPVSGALRRNPITGVAGCCARAESGHATAAPPSSVTNSRRLMPGRGLPPRCPAPIIARRNRQASAVVADTCRWSAPACQIEPGRLRGITPGACRAPCPIRRRAKLASPPRSARREQPAAGNRPSTPRPRTKLVSEGSQATPRVRKCASAYRVIVLVGALRAALADAMIPRAGYGGYTNARVIVLHSHGPSGVVPHRRRRACHRILVRWVGPGAYPCFDDGQWGRLRYLGDAVRGDGNTFAAVGPHVSREAMAREPRRPHAGSNYFRSQGCGVLSNSSTPELELRRADRNSIPSQHNK
jgi:hypothetical protein